MEDTELKNERILETMHEVLGKAYEDAELTVLKTNPPTVRVWRSGTGLDVTASPEYRYSPIEISRIGRFMDDDDLPMKGALGLVAPYAMFRIWQSPAIAANRELYGIIFIGLSAAAVAYVAGRVILVEAARKKSFKAFPIPEEMRVQARLTVQVGELLDSIA